MYALFQSYCLALQHPCAFAPWRALICLCPIGGFLLRLGANCFTPNPPAIQTVPDADLNNSSSDVRQAPAHLEYLPVRLRRRRTRARRRTSHPDRARKSVALSAFPSRVLHSVPG